MIYMRVRHWRLVLESGKMPTLWRLFAPNSTWSHCEMWGRDEYGWMVVRPSKASVNIYTLPIGANEKPEDVIPADGVLVIKAKRFKHPNPRVIYFAPWTCVEVCKAVMGIACWYITTPDHLGLYVAAGGSLPLKLKAKMIMHSFLIYALALPVTALVSACQIGVRAWAMLRECFQK